MRPAGARCARHLRAAARRSAAHRRSAESCCLPALTRFTGCRCTGPGRHLTMAGASARVAGRRAGWPVGSLPVVLPAWRPTSPSTAATGPAASPRCAARSTSCGPSATPCATTGSATPTCSADRAAPARRRPPASSPRRSTARTLSRRRAVRRVRVVPSRSSTARRFDVLELDAASNNGVDDIRDLIERAALGTAGPHARCTSSTRSTCSRRARRTRC